MLTSRCSKFIQETVRQISSQLPEFCKRYYRKHFGLFFSGHGVENMAIANVLQQEAARRHAVPISINFVAHAKFELAQPIRCHLRAFLLLIRYITL